LPHVEIGATCASGSAVRDGCEQRGVRLDALDARKRRAPVDHVAVDGLRAEHERRCVDRPRAGDADVEHRGDVPPEECVRCAERRLDGADAAARGLRTADDRELALCGGDDEEHARKVSERRLAHGAAPAARGQTASAV